MSGSRRPECVRFYCKIHEALGMSGELLAGAAMPAAVP